MPQRPRSAIGRAAHGCAALIAAALLTACAAGPDYVRPPVEVPAAYKETGPWKEARPARVDSRQAWWRAFGDDTLDELVRQADVANQNIARAEAQYRQALGVADAARAAYWPSVDLNAGAGRALTNSSGRTLGNNFYVGVAASWEPDFWGAVRRSVEAGAAGAQASADDAAAARLSIQAAVVQNYLQLRVTDLQRDLYAATTAAYAKSLQLTRSQYAAGVILRSDVALAEAQLKTTQAQAVDLEALRAQLEHAIAILIGKAPAAFSLPALAGESGMAARMQRNLPAIPVGVPSQLLQRRPDIAAAERRVAAANAEIGVASAAYFPSLVLRAGAGYSGGSWLLLFDTPSRVWSLGAVLAQSLFDGGARDAQSAQAMAAYDAAVASYKVTVLAGFQAVEDNLSILNVLQREAALQDEAVAAARLAERLALNQFRGGTATYLSVVAAQALALSNERAAVQVLGRRLTASVALITATGGGWSDAATAAPLASN